MIRKLITILARDNFLTNIDGADANDLILQMHSWESNDVGKTATFSGDVEAAFRSIKMPVLYMPSATDLYFPVEDAQYEAAFIPDCTLRQIPSLWGHTAGAGFSPNDDRFVNSQIASFLSTRFTIN
jgi:homoserine O-acetyltransferase